MKEKLMLWANYLANSKMLKFGLLLQIAAVVQIYVETLRSPFLTMVIGVVIVILRFHTNQDLRDKV